MQSIALEFASEKDLREGTKLIERLNVTGEIAIRPVGDGRWRMDIHAERPIREVSLERINARRLTTGGAGGAGGDAEEGEPARDARETLLAAAGADA